MKIDVLTLFPKMFTGPFEESIIKRAQDAKIVEIGIHNIRDWAKDKHKTVDDRPYGGGAGMVLRVDIIDAAISEIRNSKFETNSKDQDSHHSLAGNSQAAYSAVSKAGSFGGREKLKATTKKSRFVRPSQKAGRQGPRVILLSPQGKVFNQKKTQKLTKFDHLILIAGHYEGFDERIRKYLIDEEISIGDYVLTGGELPAMVLVDCVVRLIPGVLGDEESLKDETHSKQVTRSTSSGQATNKSLVTNIKYPVYTRPEEYNGWKVPEVLMSGNHAEIEKWRKKNIRKR